MAKPINHVAALNRLIAQQKKELARLKKENATLKQGVHDYYVQAQVRNAVGYYFGLEMGHESALRRDRDDDNIALKNLLYLLPGNVYWKDRYGIYLGCNDQLAKLTGFKSSQDVIGKTVYDFLDEKLADAVTEADEKVMRNNKEEHFEEEGFDSDGKTAYYLTKKVPLHNSKGEVIGMLGLSFDITERKEYENNLHKINQKLLSLDKAKQDFLDNMSHDMKTPLNGIIGCASALMSMAPDAQSKEMAEGIHNSGWKLHKFLKEVLEAAKIGGGLIEIKHEEINLREITDGILELFSPAAHQKSIKLTANISKNIPELIQSDKLRVERVLMNLTNNAIKFTSEGKVTISAKPYHKAGKDWLRISVKDTGIGISEEGQQLLFEKFSRLTTSPQTNDLSTGLGLWISKVFIQELGGTITVNSQEGKGSEFIFTIPYSSMQVSD